MRTYLSFLLLLFMLFSVNSQASYLKVEPSELLERADVVMIGNVTDSLSQEEGTIIVTYFNVVAKKVLKGDAAQNVLVRVPGGTVGKLSLVVSDTPRLAKGERVLLFLVRRADGALFVLGGPQGKLSLKGGKVIEWRISEKEFLKRMVMGAHGLAGLTYQQQVSATEGYELLNRDWKVYGDYANGKYMPDGGWMINNNNANGLSDDQLQSAFNDAAAAWDNAGACWAFGSTAGITHDTSLETEVQDYNNVITFGTPAAEGALATTSRWYFNDQNGDGTGEIIECDVVFDKTIAWAVPGCGFYYAYYGIFDIQNLATHEFGHWLALGDLYDVYDVGETMFGYSAAGGCIKKTLYSGDIAGIQAIYGTCSE